MDLRPSRWRSNGFALLSWPKNGATMTLGAKSRGADGFRSVRWLGGAQKANREGGIGVTPDIRSFLSENVFRTDLSEISVRSSSLFARIATMAGIITGAATIGSAAAAAPQMLALLATPIPVTMACDGGSCRAELSTYCLQEHAETPAPGHSYEPVGTATISFQVAAGDLIQVEPKFTARRGFTAIEVVVKQPAEADTLLVSVEGSATLAPVELSRSIDPEVQAEITRVVEVLRPIGAKIADNRPDHAAAARILTQVINSTEDMNAYLESGKGLIDERNWRRAAAPAQAVDDRAALRRARHYVEMCGQLFLYGAEKDMSHCLKGQHDYIMMGLSERYWESVRPGS